MNNAQIADTFSLLSKLMEVHGENSFKAKSYSTAAFKIDKLQVQLKDVPEEKLSSFQGIGSSLKDKISALLQTGSLQILNELISATPEGILEMLKIKGIGPKKINIIWKEMEIETVGELLYACQENRLKLYKGFGEKTQNNIAEALQFYMNNIGNYLYAGIKTFAAQTEEILKEIFGENKVNITGDFKQQEPIISNLEFVIEGNAQEIKNKLTVNPAFHFEETDLDTLVYTINEKIKLIIHPVEHELAVQKLITTSSSKEFSDTLLTNYPAARAADEASYFSAIGLPFIPAYMRHNAQILTACNPVQMAEIIQAGDIKGLLHCHSTWSDGNNSLEEMASAAKDLDMTYMLITDHSKAAFYADGLSEQKVHAQQNEVDELNKKLTPFKIFKGIECDILTEGRLDYDEETLSSFDLVIASIHSNLKMDETKAMQRLLGAVKNKFTSILGHMTGRLLLSRSGYPVDHLKVIDACAEYNVVIELNANPRRLDIDWQLIDYALKQNVMISINPDAHSIAGINDINYGILVAQKAMLPAAKNLSSFSLEAFEKFVTEQKQKRN